MDDDFKVGISVIIPTRNEEDYIEKCIDSLLNCRTVESSGFNVEFIIVDAFGQGDKIVKYWNFKGTHTGDFFGIPASGNKLDLSGTTLVSIKDGKIAREQDFFDMMSMLNQLQQNSGDVTIDAQNQGVL